MAILIVEDEASIREVLCAYLRRDGYGVVEARDGREGWELFATCSPELVLLDLNLPYLDGVTLCRQIRNVSPVPIIMVTARTEEIDELQGLNIGADDYLRKPFSPGVLMARVHALLRRYQPDTITCGDLTLDRPKMTVLKQGLKINLTTTQFNIFYALMSRPGQVLTREQILDHASGFAAADVLDRTVDAHIKTIRHLLEDDSRQPRYILTVIGKGYKLNDELQS